MDEIDVLKATYNLYDSICLADIREELVAQTSTFGCALYESCNINKLNGCGDDSFGLAHFGKYSQTRVGDFYHAHVGVDGAEGVVGRFGLAGTRNGVEQGGFTNIRETYNTSL